MYSQTKGNPLFVQEVLRFLVEEGRQAKNGGCWKDDGPISMAQRIPEGIRVVIASASRV